MPITKSLFAAATVALLAFSSCKKQDVETPATVVENTDELRQFISNTTGHPLTEITYNASTRVFIIADDAALSLEQAKEYFNNAKEAGEAGSQSTESIQHRKSYYSVAPAKAIAVKVYADASVPAAWITSLDAAIANWNGVYSKLSITRVTDSKIANIRVTGVNNGANGIIAQAYYPDYLGNPGKSITINTNYNWLDASRRLFAITHELGHNFGFGHTNSTYGTLVPGTPNSDGSSVMNSVVNYWNAFSAYDLQAIRTVYPK